MTILMVLWSVVVLNIRHWYNNNNFSAWYGSFFPSIILDMTVCNVTFDIVLNSNIIPRNRLNHGVIQSCHLNSLTIVDHKLSFLVDEACYTRILIVWSSSPSHSILFISFSSSIWLLCLFISLFVPSLFNQHTLQTNILDNCSNPLREYCEGQHNHSSPPCAEISQL